MSNYIECPACRHAIDGSARVCPSCGAEVALLLEERRLAREWLRFLAAAMGGGALLSAAIAIPLGALSRNANHMWLMWIAFASVALAVWLVADRFEPVVLGARESESDAHGRAR